MSFARHATEILRNPARIVSKANALLAMWSKSRLSEDEERRRLQAWLESRFAVDAERLRQEYLSSAFRVAYRERLQRLRARNPRGGITSDFDCESLYLIVRAAKPRSMVETGVLYGASSAHVLAAMAENGTGRLYSIDMEDLTTPLEKRTLVPDVLQDRWTLRLGDSRELLPRLLTELDSLDCFLHDSLHTYQHMTWEYATAWQKLHPDGMLLSHDVIGSSVFSNPFRDFCRANGLESAVFRNLGVAMMPDPAADAR